ncbi:MAG TPA: alpha/beta fold hydrolase [Micromonosporaceae bacterium]|nr:alpha/beta fold hydrolase [Micromonosporaceae bacterium]
MALPVPLASGRTADVFALDQQRVLRRYRDGQDATAEARIMSYLGGLGFPVPEVHAVDGSDLVLERLDGPTLLQAVVAGDVTVPKAAELLADLHRRLHHLPPQPGSEPAGRILHLDLHPDNIVLSSRGPVVIDWANAKQGPPAFDLAVSALVLAEVAVDDSSELRELAQLLLVEFLALTGGKPLPMLHRAVGMRRANPTLSDAEVGRIGLAAGLIRDSLPTLCRSVDTLPPPSRQRRDDGRLLDVDGGIRMQAGGSEQPLLLLLHGLGATSEVWDRWRPLLDRHWPGRWLAPDLPGHGGSAPLGRYTFESLAAAIAAALPTDGPVVVLGHSLGGVLGLALADKRFDVPVEAVVGLGIKVAWSTDELAKAQALAQRPVGWFPSREEAAARHLRVSGLAGLVDADDPKLDAGLCHEQGRWRLALDQRAFGVGAPDMPALLAAAQARVVLARGEHDPMVTEEQLAELDPAAVTLPGLGHNAHVENPEAVFALIAAEGVPLG